MERQFTPAEKIVDDALAKGDPRSTEYRLGMLDALRFRMNGTPIPKRYAPGTAASDAYFAGNEHGHALWRTTQAKNVEAPNPYRPG